MLSISNFWKTAIIATVTVFSASALGFADRSPTPTFIYSFSEDSDSSLGDEQRASLQQIGDAVLAEAFAYLPDLEEQITLNVLTTDRDLSDVRGVTGRADRVNEIEIELSVTYEGGLDAAIASGLRATLLHELHHTVRGWTIHRNQYGYGIDIAAINEGLAEVFAETRIGYPPQLYTDTPDFSAWADEIRALPQDANYREWMFQHPDGREAIGYRTGVWLVKKAMENSGKDVLELSRYSVRHIYKLAGY